MEPSSVPTDTPAPTVGRGSLKDPERLDVPGYIIPVIEREFDDFDTEATKFLDGHTPEPEFIGFRLKQGVYGQRQPDVNMCRIKLPFGGITPDQMDMIADVTEKYAPLNKAHITTRQNIQIHHVPLMKMAALIREIAPSGLSSREGCGNTVRNVTGDPWAGIAEGEVFDTTPYVGAYVRYFVRHPTTQLMPRKIKTAFDGTPSEDRSITGIHDIAFIAKVKDGVKGFEVRVGGGTSIMPRVAPTLWDFASADDGEYLKVAEAVFRIFDAQDWLRVNRARARIKVLVDRDGPEAVTQMIKDELEGDWVAQRDFSIDETFFNVDEASLAPAHDDSRTYAQPTDEDRKAFDAWREYNVQAQKQDGYSAVEIKITRGDLVPEQWRALGQVMRDYSGGLARTTVQQNLLLRWVRDEAVYEVWQKLVEIGVGDKGVRTIEDVVSCPGTDSCKLGITSSMGLNKAVHEKVVEMDITDPLTRDIKIKMSGCPNGCSQHHIANIGFYGASIKAGEHTIPATIPHVGGTYEKGQVSYGKRLKVRIPSKRVPDAVERWVKMYEAEREEGEAFNAFADRVGTKRFEDEIRDLAMPVEFGLDTMNMFMDWTKNVPFQVVRGEGECAV
jgi:sulfite reductase (ferredoxin)